MVDSVLQSTVESIRQRVLKKGHVRQDELDFCDMGRLETISGQRCIVVTGSLDSI